MLELIPRALLMSGKCSSSELYPISVKKQYLFFQLKSIGVKFQDTSNHNGNFLYQLNNKFRIIPYHQ